MHVVHSPQANLDIYIYVPQFQCTFNFLAYFFCYPETTIISKSILIFFMVNWYGHSSDVKKNIFSHGYFIDVHEIKTNFTSDD